MDRVLAVLIGWPVAFLILRYRWQVKNFIGEVYFAEKYLPGGTNNLIILLGFAVFAGSLMYALGTLQGLIQTFVGPFFGT